MSDNKTNLPTKQQLVFMIQRYSNIQLVPLDNNQEAITISSETAQFKKPIFIDADCGKASKKINMALQHQALFPLTSSSDPDNADTDNKERPSRIIIEGNLSLVRKAINAHKKLLGDDPYNPNMPYDRPISIMEGVNIPEYSAIEQLPDDENID